MRDSRDRGRPTRSSRGWRPERFEQFAGAVGILLSNKDVDWFDDRVVPTNPARADQVLQILARQDIVDSLGFALAR